MTPPADPAPDALADERALTDRVLDDIVMRGAVKLADVRLLCDAIDRLREERDEWKRRACNLNDAHTDECRIADVYRTERDALAAEVAGLRAAIAESVNALANESTWIHTTRVRRLADALAFGPDRPPA
jgi:hypothetical protein